MIPSSHLFHQNRIWVLPRPDGSLQTRFRFASLEPSICSPGFNTVPNPPAENAELRDIRFLFNLVPAEELAEIVRSRGLLQWRIDNRYCGRCATPLDRHRDPDEHAMTCPACGAAFYPRLSPAVIVLVTKGDQVLLEHSALHNPPFEHLVSGFVEVGESAENAVRREVFEEVGILVKNIRYVDSQPWPYPASLMLAFRAEYESGDLCPDGKEVDRCAWYSRDSLPQLPPGMSIARRLIDSWKCEAHAWH